MLKCVQCFWVDKYRQLSRFPIESRQACLFLFVLWCHEHTGKQHGRCSFFMSSFVSLSKSTLFTCLRTSRCIMASDQKGGENQRLLGAAADKNPSLLLSHLTQEWMLSFPLNTEDYHHTPSLCWLFFLAAPADFGWVNSTPPSCRTKPHRLKVCWL